MSTDLAVWRPSEAAWVDRYVRGESIEEIAKAEHAPIDTVSNLVFGALDRQEQASITAKRARRVGQLEKALKGLIGPAESGDPKAAAAVAKIVPELCALEGLYPAGSGGGAAAGSPAARASGQAGEAAGDPMKRARYVDYFLHPDRDPDLLPALIEAGWHHPDWNP